jgi:hypothetical protein
MLSTLTAETSTGKAQPRRKSSRLGAKLTFFSIVLLPIFFALSIMFDSPVPLFVPTTIFLAGIAWIAYQRIFGEDLLTLKNKERAELSDAEMNAATLRASSSGIPVGELNARRAGGTAEIIQPPRSVVEHTTRLLNND